MGRFTPAVVCRLPSLALPVFLLVIQGCSAAALQGQDGSALPSTPVSWARGEWTSPGLHEIMASPPGFTWEESVFGPSGDYLYVLGEGSDPTFFVTADSLHYLDPDNRLLRYQRFDEGFTIMEVKKRKGIAYTPECPVVLHDSVCLEEHYFLIAYVVECREGCTGRAMVFDSFSPIRIFPNNPTLMLIQRHLENRRNILHDPKISIVFEEYGVIDEKRPRWQKYLEDRIEFIFETAAHSPLVEIKR